LQLLNEIEISLACSVPHILPIIENIGWRLILILIRDVMIED